MKKKRMSEQEKQKDALKPGILERVGRAAEIPTHGLLDVPYMELVSNREMLIENSKGIIEYGEDQIRVSAGKYVIRIIGRDLHLKSLSEEALLIHGFFISIDFVI